MTDELQLRPMDTPADLARAIALLQSILEHRRRARTWQRGCYPISENGWIRPGAPDVSSPEVRILLASGIVSFISTSSDTTLPDSVLRLLDMNVEKAEQIVGRYINQMQHAR